MRGNRHTIVLVSIMLLHFIGARTEAAYFVFSKKGNVRSGAGTKYRVVGQLEKDTIVGIPDTFTDYEAKWIAIDEKIRPDDNTNGEKVIYSKWVHRSLGVVIKGDLDEVEKYFAIRESGWTEDMQELILTGKVEIGMTTHMVFYAWGRPDRVKQITESEENAEMWVYEKRTPKIQYLLFKDGILTEMKHSQN